MQIILHKKYFIFRRFTGKLAETAKHVIALDFMEKFVEKNKASHGHLENVTVQQADALKYDPPQGTK